ncbi:MAG: hypothetical protein R3F02_14550 [Thiolinea sp.]
MQLISPFKRTIISILALTPLLLTATANAQEELVELDAKLNNQQNPRQLYLRAGTYQVTPVKGDNSAWSVWAYTTCEQVQGCARTVPTKFTGLHNNYYVISEHLGTVTVNNRMLSEVDETPKHRMNSYYLVNDETRAYEITEPMVYADEARALAGAQSSVFTLKENARVKFALLDNSRITDNRGGMSLKVTRIDVPQ